MTAIVCISCTYVKRSLFPTKKTLGMASPQLTLQRLGGIEDGFQPCPSAAAQKRARNSVPSIKPDHEQCQWIHIYMFKLCLLIFRIRWDFSYICHVFLLERNCIVYLVLCSCPTPFVPWVDSAPVTQWSNSNSSLQVRSNVFWRVADTTGQLPWEKGWWKGCAIYVSFVSEEIAQYRRLEKWCIVF